MTITLTKPSTLLHEMRIERVNQWNLFKFSDALQDRMEDLLERRKDDALSLTEVAELDSIGELDRIFTHINAMIAAQNAD